MKSKIFCIVGESGTGKTALAQYLEEYYNIPMIQSYTDRKPRYVGENGHKFISEEDFDRIDIDEMIAITEFGRHRYCCLHEDVEKINTYVIDEKGLDYLIEHHSDKYEIVSIRLYRMDELKCVSPERLARDEGMFKKGVYDFDYLIINNYKHIDEFYDRIDEFMNEIIGEI